MVATDRIQEVRASLAVKMIRKARSAGYDVVALDSDSEEYYLREAESCGAHVVAQKGKGMGVARREALSAAETEYPRDDAYIWMEPEKVAMITHLENGVREVTAGKDFAFFNRNSLVSYPPEQAHAYDLARLAAKYVLGIDLDFIFGPMVMSRNVLHFFLEYDGVYGDEWDSIHVQSLAVSIVWQVGASEERRSRQILIKCMISLRKRVLYVEDSYPEYLSHMMSCPNYHQIA